MLCSKQMENYIRPFFVICAALYAHQSLAFLLSTECLLSSPCTCSSLNGSYIYIYCQSRSLTTIPNIQQYNATVNSITIDLSINSINSIPNNAFINFRYVRASVMELHLNNNSINNIGTDAFKGVENIKSLQLQANNLTSIPFAISKLTSLKTLDICQNPLHSIDSSVMPNIGRSLNFLRLDLGWFSEWPADLHYLRTLQTLFVNEIPYSHLDINAFHGFEHSLNVLVMDFAKLEKVSYSICQLNRLTDLTIRYGYNLKENESAIFEPCGHTLPNVTSLNINSNNLYFFPVLFSQFPFLIKLTAAYNKFEYIEAARIPSDSRLTSIDLNNNLFDRIPSALNKLKSLNTVYLQDNTIKTIESADLFGLPKLMILILNNNPLAYIEPEAFSHNPELFQLELENTRLNHIPEAVIYLPKLYFLRLDGNHIQCTCDMSYLKPWNISSVRYFTDMCASSTEIVKTFIMTSLQSCP